MSKYIQSFKKLREIANRNSQINSFLFMTTNRIIHKIKELMHEQTSRF